MQPAVSVIIPVYNRPQMLKRAIESVIRQTYDDFEVIVVDDGSGQPAQPVIDRFADKRITGIRQDHAGVSAARNRGVDAARGRYIAFLDSDDEWHRVKLERQMTLLAQNPAYRICYTGEQWIRNEKPFNHPKSAKKFSGYIFDRCLDDCFIGCSTVVLEKSLFYESGGFDTALPVCEDYDLWLKISARYPIVVLEQPLIYKYGGHTGQLSFATWGLDRFRIMSIRNLLRSGKLSNMQAQSARCILAAKLSIVCGGCLKHGRYDQFAYFLGMFLDDNKKVTYDHE